MISEAGVTMMRWICKKKNPKKKNQNGCRTYKMESIKYLLTGGFIPGPTPQTISGNPNLIPPPSYFNIFFAKRTTYVCDKGVRKRADSGCIRKPWCVTSPNVERMVEGSKGEREKKGGGGNGWVYMFFSSQMYVKRRICNVVSPFII